MRTLLHKRAELSFRTDADWLGLKERNGALGYKAHPQLGNSTVSC